MTLMITVAHTRKALVGEGTMGPVSEHLAFPPWLSWLWMALTLSSA